jgi:hypothetical protein
MKHVSGAIAAFVLGAIAALDAQAPTQRPQVGTGVISGVVTSDEATPRPLRHAAVMLFTGEISFPLTIVTDDAGRFAFGNLPAGPYGLSASKAGYVSASYGAKRAGRGSGVPIALGDGQQVSDLTLRLPKGSVITGTVRSPSGAPMTRLNVQIYQVSTGGGGRHLSPTAIDAMTDDRGVYRAFGLAEGDYLIQVSPSLATVASEARLVTAAEVRWADAISSPSGMATPPPPQGQSVSYAPMYFPGTADLGAASIVSLGSAEERSGVDIALAFVATARVSGTVLDQDGNPVTAQVQLRPSASQSDLLGLMGGSFMAAPARAGGAFEFSAVKPGQYTASVRTAPGGRGGGPGVPMSVQLLTGGGPNAGVLWASADVAVDGQDVSNIVLRLQPGMTVSGKVVYEGATPAQDVATRVSLMAPPAGASALELAASVLTSQTTAMAAADGTFAVQSVLPGKYRVTVGALGQWTGPRPGASGWMLKSAMLNGRDVSDESFVLRPNEDVTGIVVTMTDRPTELSGSVTDRSGRPAPGFPIVVFSTDRAYWTPASRRVQTAKPASDGRYHLTGLPAGEYFMCALTDLDRSQMYDPAFLESLVAGSFKITLADGEKKTQDLKLASGGT